MVSFLPSNNAVMNAKKFNHSKSPQKVLESVDKSESIKKSLKYTCMKYVCHIILYLFICPKKCATS